MLSFLTKIMVSAEPISF